MSEVCTDLGDYEAARKYLTDALGVIRATPEASVFRDSELAGVLHDLGSACWLAGDMESARGYLEEARTVASILATRLDQLGSDRSLSGAFVFVFFEFRLSARSAPMPEYR